MSNILGKQPNLKLFYTSIKNFSNFISDNIHKNHGLFEKF